jgi:hypothetical protein
MSSRRAPGSEVHEPLQLLIQRLCRDVGADNEVIQLLHGQRRDAGALEEGVHVLDVLPQKVEGARVVQVHRLTNVDHDQLALSTHSSA